MFAIGDLRWPGLSKLSEECGEVVQIIGELMGTGGEEKHWDGTDLKLRLQEEISDVVAAAVFVEAHCGLDKQAITRRLLEKYDILEKWHAERTGAVLLPEKPGPETAR